MITALPLGDGPQQCARCAGIPAVSFEALNKRTLVPDLRFALHDGSLRPVEPRNPIGILHEVAPILRPHDNPRGGASCIGKNPEIG